MAEPEGPRTVRRDSASPGDLDPLDLLGFDGLLTDRERATRDLVRRFVADHVLPEIEGWFERGEFPRDLVPEFGRQGLLSLGLPDATT